jgi:hypothetical protein
MQFLLWLVSGVAVLLVPGLALEVWLGGGQRSPLERLVTGLGLSLALTALFGGLCFFIGLRIAEWMLFAFYGVCLLALAAGVWRRRKRLRLDGTLIAGLAGFGVLIAWRFYQGRELLLPAWVDGVHHVLIVRRMLEAGGVPADLTPYLPVPFFYHYAFHAVSAVFAALGHIPPEKAVLWMGHVLNAAVSLAVYRLGMALWKDWRRACLAALLSGFVLQMPAYYLSWGRYTLLAGLVLLALAMAESLQVKDWRGGLRLALLVGGLALAHYLALGLFGLWLAVLLGAELVKAAKLRSLAKVNWKPAAYALSGLLLAAAWLVRSFTLAQKLVGVVVNDAQHMLDSEGWIAIVDMLGPRRNEILLMLGLIGMGLALFQQRRRKLAIWSVLLLAMTFLPVIRLEPFRPDQVALVLFLPAAVFTAELLAAAAEALGKVTRAWCGQAGLGLVALLLVVWGLRETRNLLNPLTLLAGPADLKAIAWVQDNTPVEARFLINATLWQTGSYRGVDGGYWLMPLTGRWTSLPPAVYGWGPRALIDEVNGYARLADSVTGCDEPFQELLSQTRADYVYTREDIGKLKAAWLADCPMVAQVYSVGGVQVWRVVR